MRSLIHRALFTALWLVPASVSSPGCASHGIPLCEAALELNSTLEKGPSPIVPGDTILVSFPDKPDWSLTVEVRSDGKASFGWVGEFDAGGQTIWELEQALKAAYEVVFPKLPVNFTYTPAGTRNVYVMGEVEQPGLFEIKGRMSLLEALGAAGGPKKETAMLEYLLLVRWSPMERKQRAWRIDAAVENWEHGVALLLQPHDVIFVPNTPIDDVNIWVDQYIRRMIPFPYLIPAY